MYKPLIFILLLLAATSCRDPHTDWHDTPDDTFECLSRTIATRYCFLDEKNIDWPATVEKYRAKIEPGISDRELFGVCATMLDELQDGHVNLISPFNVSYYRKWWSDYPQDFNLRTLQEYYFDFDWQSVSGMNYKIFEGNIGYIYIPSFSTPLSESSLDWILAALSQCNALIVDIRNNGGGLLSNVGTLASRFISKKTLGGYITHKTGPGSKDFSKPYPFYYSPAKERPCFLGRMAVLTNRSTFSAANTFAAFMSHLDGVEIIGARTGGGGGMPFSADLPNGWSVRFSAAPIYDSAGNNIETGIEPSAGCEIHCTEAELTAGWDAILNFALSRLKPTTK